MLLSRLMIRPVGIVFSLGLFVLSGCADSKNAGKLPVTGIVNFQGQPVSDGAITFLPITTGNPTSATIHDGLFELFQARGLLPGKYRVEISASKKTGKKIPGMGPDGTVDEIVEAIPEKYNHKSELTVDFVSPQETPLKFDLTD